jgi:hypothetical protein
MNSEDLSPWFMERLFDCHIENLMHVMDKNKAANV